MTEFETQILPHKESYIIEFDDPAYLRSDVIVWDEKDGSLHAICHEAAHLIGHLEGDIAREFTNKADIWITAQHFTGQAYKLRVPLKISK